MGMEREPPGLTFLDHTADVALEVEASSREELFRRAATGLRILLLGDAPDGGGAREIRSMAVEAEDLPALLRGWLRELIWWHDTAGISFVEANFPTFTSCSLDARVTVAPPGRSPIREIKGVTLHGLRAGRDGAVWRARVVFDV